MTRLRNRRYQADSEPTRAPKQMATSIHSRPIPTRSVAERCASSGNLSPPRPMIVQMPSPATKPDVAPASQAARGASNACQHRRNQRIRGQHQAGHAEPEIVRVVVHHHDDDARDAQQRDRPERVGSRQQRGQIRQIFPVVDRVVGRPHRRDRTRVAVGRAAPRASRASPCRRQRQRSQERQRNPPRKTSKRRRNRRIVVPGSATGSAREQRASPLPHRPRSRRPRLRPEPAGRRGTGGAPQLDLSSWREPHRLLHPGRAIAA